MAKSDLQEHLWPTSFVVEKNLANLIGEIRDALGDDPSDPRFIRTVHRFGYAFRERRLPRPVRREPRRRVSFSVKWVNGRVALDEGAHVLGRDPDAEIFLDSPGVSRRHALITIAADRATIEDLGKQERDVCRGSARGRSQIDWRWRHHPGGLCDADGQGASDAELHRDQPGWKARHWLDHES